MKGREIMNIKTSRCNAVCAQCEKDLFITMDGSHPFITTENGGKYFCNIRCKKIWQPEAAPVEQGKQGELFSHKPRQSLIQNG